MAHRACSSAHPSAHPSAIRFAETVQELTLAARASGWQLPGFRSPPGRPDAARTVRRGADGSVIVAVRMRDRPWAAVVADLIEGVVVANHLSAADADRCRERLWAACSEAPDVAAA